MVIMTIGELVIVPTSSTYVANLAPTAKRGRYMSIYGLSWGAATGIGSLLGGFLNDFFGPQAIWYGAGLIGTTATILFLSYYLRYKDTASISVVPSSPTNSNSVLLRISLSAGHRRIHGTYSISSSSLIRFSYLWRLTLRNRNYMPFLPAWSQLILAVLACNTPQASPTSDVSAIVAQTQTAIALESFLTSTASSPQIVLTTTPTQLSQLPTSPTSLVTVTPGTTASSGCTDIASMKLKRYRMDQFFLPVRNL